MSNKIRVSLSDSIVTEETNKRGRMKITFKLTKEESEAFKKFREAFRPDGTSDDDFSKGLFMLGAKLLDAQFKKHMQESMEALEAQKAAANNAEPQPANPESNGDGS